MFPVFQRPVIYTWAKEEERSAGTDSAFARAQDRARVEGVRSDSSSVDNEALAVNVLLPGMLQGRNLLQMLEAGVQLLVAGEGGISAWEANGRVAEKWKGHANMRHLPPVNYKFTVSLARWSHWQLL